jgi:hypothetical protein
MTNERKHQTNFLIFGPTLKLTYYVFFLNQISSRRKESYLGLHKTSFLMLEAKQINSSANFNILFH